MGMCDTTTCVYQFTYYKRDSDDTQIAQYFIMRVFRICMKVDSFVAHMFYSWSSIHNTEVPIAKNKNKYLLSLNKIPLYLLGEMVIPIYLA